LILTIRVSLSPVLKTIGSCLWEGIVGMATTVPLMVVKPGT